MWFCFSLNIREDNGPNQSFIILCSFNTLLIQRQLAVLIYTITSRVAETNRFSDLSLQPALCNNQSRHRVLGHGGE